MQRSIRRLFRGIVCRAAVHLPQVVSLLPTPIPVLVRSHRYQRTESTPTLLVLLPGIGDTAEDYERHGFTEAVQRQRVPIDLALVDAHYAYYAKRSVLDRIRDDVVAPARASGYWRIWLGGISMGGFGALLYASRFPGEIDGVVALAPYLGGTSLIKEITGAGGVRRWNPTDVSGHEHERSVWSWLRHDARQPRQPPIVLGYGVEDRFAAAHRLLSEVLPPDRVLTTPGKHDWPVWRRLWDSWLAQDVFQQSLVGLPAGSSR
jgi:pimeloyl-ACP methyl ester carboxylesterase